MREIIKDEDGTRRFKPNAVVQWLVRTGKVNLNDIPVWSIPGEDLDEFWQMLGYKVCDYCELSFISESSKDEAWGEG